MHVSTSDLIQVGTSDAGHTCWGLSGADLVAYVVRAVRYVYESEAAATNKVESMAWLIRRWPHRQLTLERVVACRSSAEYCLG